MSNEQSLKARPQSYLLFYRQMITVAQSLSCSSIALGMFGDARLLLDAANSFWKEIHEHDLLFPFESRKNALETFQEACEQSWLVWRSFLSKQEETVGVWQTAGPSILPNASHYVTTCVTRPPKPLEAQMLEAQERALERVQELIAVESQKEQDAIDDAIAKGEKMRKKRAVDPFQHAQYLSFFLQELESMKGGNESEQVLNFCGQSNCVDCAVWQCIARNWNTQTDSLRSKWQNLAGEYCARLKCNLERDKNVPMIVAKNLPKKRELAQNGEARPSKRPKSNDQDEDIDDKLHDDVDDEEKEEFDDEEDEEDADFEEEDEEEVIDEDAEEEDGQVILVEDEEIQDEDEEEEEAEEEEKEKDDEEDLDDDLEEEEEDDDDDEEEDDEDDADEDY